MPLSRHIRPAVARACIDPQVSRKHFPLQSKLHYVANNYKMTRFRRKRIAEETELQRNVTLWKCNELVPEELQNVALFRFVNIEFALMKL